MSSTSLAYKIMRKVKRYGRGKWIGTPKDFLKFGCSLGAVYKALSRLVKQGKLRRLGRGLYDFPRTVKLLNRYAPANIDAAINALKRRDKISIVPDGISAAHQLGLTNAVPARVSYLTDGLSRKIKIGKRILELQHTSEDVMKWANRPGAPVVQALHWLGDRIANSTKVINTLRQRLSNDIKQDLINSLNSLPCWMISIVRQIHTDQSCA